MLGDVGESPEDDSESWLAFLTLLGETRPRVLTSRWAESAEGPARSLDSPKTLFCAGSSESGGASEVTLRFLEELALGE